MHPIVRNFLAVFAGVVVGSIVNMCLVTIGPMIIPLPEGTDVSNFEKLQESMSLFTPANFLFPFLGHALGTFVGAFVTAKLAAFRKMQFAMAIGGWFLFGGIMMVVMVGGPLWFNVADLVLAYLPTAFLGGVLAGGEENATVT